MAARKLILRHAQSNLEQTCSKRTFGVAPGFLSRSQILGLAPGFFWLAPGFLGWLPDRSRIWGLAPRFLGWLPDFVARSRILGVGSRIFGLAPGFVGWLPDFGGSLPDFWARSRILGLAPGFVWTAPGFLGSLPDFGAGSRICGASPGGWGQYPAVFLKNVAVLCFSLFWESNA